MSGTDDRKKHCDTKAAWDMQTSLPTAAEKMTVRQVDRYSVEIIYGIRDSSSSWDKPGHQKYLGCDKGLCRYWVSMGSRKKAGNVVLIVRLEPSGLSASLPPARQYILVGTTSTNKRRIILPDTKRRGGPESGCVEHHLDWTQCPVPARHNAKGMTLSAQSNQYRECLPPAD